MQDNTASRVLVKTGVDGLDEVLEGGLTPDRVYLVQGDPGAGKTTLALHYLRDGVRVNERVLYVTLGETAEELRDVARSHGWSLDGIDLFELEEHDTPTRLDEEYTLFHPSEVELGDTTRRLVQTVERVKPRRLVFDSLSEMRLLARDPLRYRRQILLLKQFLSGRSCTVLLLDDGTSEEGDLQLQSIAHGVIKLEHFSPEFGAERRRMRVIKMRGKKYRGGYHDFVIEDGGLIVYPRLAASVRAAPSSGVASSGIAQLDALCGGGLDRGSSTLILGQAGTGKSTIAAQFVAAACARGEKASIFTFDEGGQTLLVRARGLGMPLDEHVRSGLLRVRQVDPAELAPSQFTFFVQDEAARGARVILIDSLNGYLSAMPDERFLLIQMHELLTYLDAQGVVAILTMTQHGMIGDRTEAPVDMSYLADSSLLLRYFELDGSVRKAVSMIKRRRGRHEKTIRELEITSEGVRVGDPIVGCRGVLSGLPIVHARERLDHAHA